MSERQKLLFDDISSQKLSQYIKKQKFFPVEIIDNNNDYDIIRIKYKSMKKISSLISKEIEEIINFKSIGRKKSSNPRSSSSPDFENEDSYLEYQKSQTRQVTFYIIIISIIE